MRVINSAQLQAEKRAAQAKISRVGIDQAGMPGPNASSVLGNDPNKEWKELKYHGVNSLESEREFEKLHQFGNGSKVKKEKDQEDMLMDISKRGVDEKWSIISSHEFQDLLAPFDNTEDFSTA